MNQITVTGFTQKWNARFMQVALLSASWSKDTTQVGAVIVDPNRKIVSTGYNGLPAGMDDGKITDREWKIKRVLHAEMNALANAHCDVSGCVMFVTRPPCNECAKHIASFGIKAVAYLPDADLSRRWDGEISKEIFRETGVLFFEMQTEVPVFEGLHLNPGAGAPTTPAASQPADAPVCQGNGGCCDVDDTPQAEYIRRALSGCRKPGAGILVTQASEKPIPFGSRVRTEQHEGFYVRKDGDKHIFMMLSAMKHPHVLHLGLLETEQKPEILSLPDCSSYTPMRTFDAVFVNHPLFPPLLGLVHRIGKNTVHILHFEKNKGRWRIAVREFERGMIEKLPKPVIGLFA